MTTVQLDSLKLNPRNPRSISKERFAALCKSLKDFPAMMELRPLVVDKAGTLLGGNMRYQALKANGLTEIPAGWVKRADKLTKEQARRFIIADNLPFGDWDMDVLSADFDVKELTEFGFDEHELLGAFEDDELQDAEPQIDKAAELNKKWKVKTGDLWMIGEHRLLCGDSTKAEDVERVMGGEKASLFCTDPPYGVAYCDLQNAKCKHTKKWARIENDNLEGADTQKFLESCFKAWLPHLMERAAWYIWHAHKVQGYFTAAAAAAQVLYHRQIVWVKPSLILGRGHFHLRHELCLYGWRQGFPPKEPKDRGANTVWEFKRDSTKDYLHPTQKPAECFSWPMNYSTTQGDICAEPFAGSGTQYIAGQNCGRTVYGCELTPAYCAVILQRMTDAFPDLKIERLTTGKPRRMQHKQRGTA